MRTLPDFKHLRTPFYLIDEQAIEDNCRLLAEVGERAGCRILLAQKAFSMFPLYPLLRQYLQGTTASGLYEARLGRTFFGGQTHVFSPAFQEEEFDEIVNICDTIVFNSLTQWRRFKKQALAGGRSCGLRVNPQTPTQKTDLYDPCTAHSRLGISKRQLEGADLSGLSGLHFHCLCEQDASDLQIVLKSVIEQFGGMISRMKWVNFGGGHHITRPGYDLDLLVELVQDFKRRFAVDVYLEPGEAVALNAGYLVSRVVDLAGDTLPVAILDTSATCHMPDVLEMPYRPRLIGAGAPGEKDVTVRLGGPTCLAGDIIGDYSFEQMPRPGDPLIFEDMAIYTMVKNNTFNGMRLPDIVLWRKDNRLEMIRSFGYEDFKTRLG